jgi:site-specific DNA recombinase
MTKAVGYVRVSSEEQAQHGYSIDAQIAKVKAYADLYEIELADVVIDAGISAKNLKRPGLARCLEMLTKGEVEALVIFKLDRLTRSMKDWQHLIDGYFSEKAGKALLSVSDQIDTRSASGRLCLNMLMSIAQWEREVTGERTSIALKHKQNKGDFVGKPAYGSKVVDQKLVADQDEQIIINQVLQMKAERKTLQQIADDLNNRQIPSKRGGVWYPTTVKNVLQCKTA